MPRFRDDEQPHHRAGGAAGLGPYGLNAIRALAYQAQAPGQCFYTQAGVPISDLGAVSDQLIREIYFDWVCEDVMPCRTGDAGATPA